MSSVFRSLEPGRDLEADRKLLEAVFDEAAPLALQHFEAQGGHWYKGPGQVLTEADLAIDRLLKAHLGTARPDYGWLSEESRDDGTRHTSGRVWMVDPIDGTRAFADHIPEFAISVGLVEAGRPVVGIVENPATRERFVAVRGQGAWLNGAPLQTSTKACLDGARILSSRGELRQRRWPERAPEASFHAVGSLAYKLALVADGRFDGFMSWRRCHDWDIAAALLLLEETGASVSDRQGCPIRLNKTDLRHNGLAIGGTATLHHRLRERLQGRGT